MIRQRIMTYVSVIGILIVMIVFVICVLSRYKVGPRLSIEPDVVELGTMSAGATAVHTVQLRNVGDQELHINDIIASCSCTVADIRQDSLLPGESTTVEVRFDSPGIMGDVRKGLAVSSNDSESPLRYFYIEGYVSLGTRISSKMINFGQVNLGDVREHTIHIDRPVTNTDERIQIVMDEDHEYSELNVVLGEGRRGNSVEVTPINITLGPITSECANYTREIEIRSGDETSFMVEVNYSVVPVVNTRPYALRIGNGNIAEWRGDLMLTWPDVIEDFRIDAVVSRNDLFAADIIMSSPGQCEVLVSPKASESLLSQQIGYCDTIEVSYVIGDMDQWQETVAIPVYVVNSP